MMKKKDKIKLNDNKEEDSVPKSKEDFLKLINQSKVKRGDEKLWFFSNQETFSQKMLKLGHIPIQEVTVPGISGGLIAESSFHEIDVCCLFSPLNELFKFVSVDARAALSVLKVIDTLLGGKTKMDLKKYENDYSKVEDKMIDVIKNIQSPNSKESYFNDSLYA